LEHFVRHLSGILPSICLRARRLILSAAAAAVPVFLITQSAVWLRGQMLLESNKKEALKPRGSQNDHRSY